MHNPDPTPANDPVPHGSVVSVNVGRPQNLPWRGTTVRTAFRKTPVAGAVEIRGTNLAGDGQADTEVHGGPDKCLFAYPIEHYPHWEAWLCRAGLRPGSFGENLTLCGLDEATVALGDRFRIGSAEVIVTEPRQPCYKIDVSLQHDGAAVEMIRSGRVGFYLGLVQAGHFVLFGNGIDPQAALSEEARVTWRRLSGLCVTIGAQDYRDVDGTYATWFAALDAIVVLVRPDFQVFGASAQPTHATAMVIELQEQLSLRVIEGAELPLPWLSIT